jgi:hypothetical protein
MSDVVFWLFELAFASANATGEVNMDTQAT